MVAQSIFIIILGMVFGSFLYTMVERLQLGDSLTRRSSCDHCSTTISIIGLIPVLGYIAMGGNCKTCGESISKSYPVTEILNAALVYAIFAKTGWQASFIHAFLIFEALLVIAVLDFRTRLIFSQPVIAAFLVQCVWLITGNDKAPLNSLIGLFMGAGIFHWIGYLYQKIRKRVGLGDGDATLLGLIGFAFGWNILFATIFWSAVFGIVCGGGMLVLKRQSWHEEIAFGPWLVLAAFLVWYFPEFFQQYPFDTAYQVMLQ